MTANQNTDIVKISLLIGLPGSGKSTMGEQLAQADNAYFLDDISNQTLNISTFFIDFFQNNNNQNIEHLIISDVYFCYPNILKKAHSTLLETFPSAIIDDIYFENSYEKCLNNVHHRISLGDNRKVFDFLSILTKEYIIPENIQPVSIWQKPSNQFSPK